MTTTDIRTILCPTDFSETSEEAARYAVSFGARVGVEEVHLLHVQQKPTYVLAEGPILPAGSDDALREHLARELEALTQRYSAHDVAVTPHLLWGVPYEVIVEEAKRLDVDLIVIGTHGRTGAAHFFLGSVAERVVRSSPIPVCTLRVG